MTLYQNSDLEYDRLRKQLASRCHSHMGQEKALALCPLEDIEVIRKSQSLISEIQEVLERGLDFSFEELGEITQLFEDSVFSLFGFDEFAAVDRNVRCSEAIIARLNSLDDFPLLKGLARRLTALPDIARRFTEIFDFEGAVLDTASPELASIRRRTANLRSRIQKTMQSLLGDTRYERYLQDKFVTQREDRYVLPIKDSSVPFVEGIVQGQSGSKATVFVEPVSVIPMNNELQMVKQEEKQELYRIFAQFTSDIKAQKKQLLKNQELLVELDFRFACGRMCRLLKAQVPRMVQTPGLKLNNARHPLLTLSLGSPAKVVPFSMELGAAYRLLILSGPNTGGKTVLMKAVGLITLMAMSGLTVPADSDSEIGMFRGVYADIGDDQSIESALSTFSSHLEKISRMLEKADPETMILIDELGAATDPQQGSALAQAILESFAEKGCLGIVTTHYTALKIFGENHPACANASMQFDLKSLHPTYRFVCGFPGDSFAIEVAASLGIDPELIERAKHLAGSQNLQFTELLKKMQEEKKKLSVASYQFELKTRNLEGKLKELESREADWQEELKHRRQKHLKDLQAELIAQQKLYQNELNELKGMEKNERKAHAERKLHAVEKQNTELMHELASLGGSGHKPLTAPQKGDRVYLSNFDAEAVIIDIQGGNALVDMNGISFKTPVDSLFAGKPAPEELHTSFVKSSASPRARFELKLLGLTFDEAMPLIDEFLDDAALAGLHNLRIVHGKGTGALRSKIRDYLKRKKGIVSIDTPPISEGGSGVTVVRI